MNKKDIDLVLSRLPLNSNAKRYPDLMALITSTESAIAWNMDEPGNATARVLNSVDDAIHWTKHELDEIHSELYPLLVYTDSYFRAHSLVKLWYEQKTTELLLLESEDSDRVYLTKILAIHSCNMENRTFNIDMQCLRSTPCMQLNTPFLYTVEQVTQEDVSFEKLEAAYPGFCHQAQVILSLGMTPEECAMHVNETLLRKTNIDSETMLPLMVCPD